MKFAAFCGGLVALALIHPALAADKIAVTKDNYEVAESDLSFSRITGLVGSNAWLHFPGPTPLDNQTVVRMNRDTIYSAYVADVSEGGTVTIPPTDDGRYLAVMVVENDHFISQVWTEPGTYDIDAETDFAMIVTRTMFDPDDPADMENVKRYQNGVIVETASKRDHVMPDYDMDQLMALRANLVEEGQKLGSLNNMQGARGEVDPQMHLYGTALGWGLLPDQNARYLNYYSSGDVADASNCMKADFEVPPFSPPGFFSLTVYDKDGWITDEKAVLSSHNLDYNEDGSFTVHFGDCPDDTSNLLPITDNWDMLLRVYEPDLAALETYKMPVPEIVN